MGKFLRRHWMLWVALTAVIVLRLPSLWEPLWYDDEAISLVVGQQLGFGKLLYAQIHDNKPPLLYWFSALAVDLVWLKAILLVWMLGTTAGFYGLVRRVVERYMEWRRAEKEAGEGRDPKSSKVNREVYVNVYKELHWNQWLVGMSLAIFVLFTSIPKWEGNIANGEIFMIGLGIGAMWLFLSDRWKQDWLRLMVSGGLIACASLFKLPAAVDLVVLGWFVVLMSGVRWSWNQALKQLLALSGGFLLIHGLVFGWFGLHGTLGDYWAAAWLQNFGYLASWSANTRVAESSLDTSSDLMIRGAWVLGFTGVLWLIRKQVNPVLLLIGLWWGYSLFAALLSERPYPHYLLQIVPAMALGLGMVVWLRKYLEQVMVIGLLLVTIWGIRVVDFWKYESRAYYDNFVAYATGRKDLAEYRSYFWAEMNDTYATEEYLSGKGADDEPIFVWSNKSAVMALGHHPAITKYVVAYHVDDFVGYELTMDQLEAAPPRYIVHVGRPEYYFPELEDFTNENYAVVWNRGIHTVYEQQLGD